MRIRSTGPTVETTLVPDGTVSKTLTHTELILWKSGGKGTILGVPFTMGVELVPYQGSTIISQSVAFDEAVKAAMIAQAGLGLPPTVEVPTSYVYEEIQDEVVPNYKARVAAGEIFNNPLLQTYSAFTGPSNARPSQGPVQTSPVDWRSYSWFRGEYGGLESYVGFGFSVSVKYTAAYATSIHHDAIVGALLDGVSSPVDDAVIGVFEKLQAADLDLALMAAEAGETISYLRLLVMRAVKLCRAISNPKTVFQYAPKAAAQISSVGLVKALSNAWLEARYALRPLLIDIDNTILYLSGGKAISRKDRYTYRKREANSTSGTRTVMVGQQQVVVHYSLEKSARAGVLAKATLGTAGSDFGFMNWASIAFEKIKFSFILAWLVNVGGLLYRLNPNMKLVPLASWCTEVTSLTYVGDISVSTPSGVITVPISGQYRLKSRLPVEDNLPPPLTLAVNLDSFKIIDLLAIISQIKSR